MRFQKLLLGEKYIPFLAFLLIRVFVQDLVPMNKSFGIKLRSVDDAETVLTLKKKHENQKTNYYIPNLSY